MTEVMGLPALLRSIASRLENGVHPLSKDLLLDTAEKIEKLEEVAWVASMIVCYTPVKSSGSTDSKVPRHTLIKLAHALNAAGRYGPNGDYVKQRR